ncbi:helix-hairpin-helix domain-containing protein [Rudanella lutea]|uniref:helix-hairpin-helix domain-containing protein n=1 Tax=Rudanella lutea TaxID=451374 RepID=UPI0003699520|nr:helix-hairpin-helix domain-containing protein [Rudanella lutea]
MFKRLIARVRDHFGFSQREANGFMVVLLIGLLALLTPFLYRWLIPEPQRDTSAADARKLDSLVSIMRTQELADEAERRSRYGNRYGKPDNERTTAEQFHEPKLFRFDPNTVSIAGWQQLGLPKYMAERIDKYRRKGGQFRRKEDLLKIYDFPPDLYEQLEPYVQLPERSAPAGPNTLPGNLNRPTEAIAANEPTRPRFEKPAPPQVFDINTADTNDLKKLKGIGSGRARQILKFRDALGGFASPEQFAEIFNIDSLALSELQKYARVQSAVRRIRINSASAEDLDRLPYLSRRQSEIIIAYRQQHGAFTSLESLRPIRILDARLLEKLGPYLEF